MMIERPKVTSNGTSRSRARELTAIEEPSRFILFNLRQRLWLGGRPVTSTST